MLRPIPALLIEVAILPPLGIEEQPRGEGYTRGLML